MDAEKIDLYCYLLKEYSNFFSIPVRSTSDLSPLEEWLLMKLVAEKVKEGER